MELGLTKKTALVTGSTKVLEKQLLSSWQRRRGCHRQWTAKGQCQSFRC